MFHGYFWHPFYGTGYQFWSGIAGSFITAAPGWIVALVLFLRHQNCHVKRCPRRAWHPSEEHGGHPVCKKHHPHYRDQNHPINQEGK